MKPETHRGQESESELLEKGAKKPILLQVGVGDKHIILDHDGSDVHDSDSPGVRQTRIVEANIVAGVCLTVGRVFALLVFICLFSF